MDVPHTRNFCIIAHIDHGKSSLADRILLATGAITEREFQNQLLDSMDLERERGITIKASAVSVRYRLDGEDYGFNLIDTPGHVDVSYEVSRSLAAAEGAFLGVVAVDGVAAQTLANLYLALEGDLEVVPVINKIDLPNARPLEVAEELSGLGLDTEGLILTSAKTGQGVDAMLEAAVRRFPPPTGDVAAPLRALIFDSEFNDYRGVVTYLRVVDGQVAARDRVRLLGTGRTYEVDEVGIFTPAMRRVEVLPTGSVGYAICNIKSVTEVRVGDTLAPAEAGPAVRPLPGYVQPKPMVYCGLYPTTNAEFPALRAALEKLRLNDASFTFAPETSDALGFGFRCGFLGLLHMEVVQERLEREAGVDVCQTAPNVTYQVLLHGGELREVDSPSKVPEGGEAEEIREPVVRLSVICPADCIGAIMKLDEERRGRYRSTEYLSPRRVILTYDLPLSEIVYDYYDKMKSLTRGYGTMDYHLEGYRAADLVRLNILVGGQAVDALSVIAHRDSAYHVGKRLIARLKKEIPRHLFEVPLQAAIGGRVIARETIKPLRKNVTAKCYGGDVSRKRKLLEKQKEGKRRMKHVGNVEIPQEAFMAVLTER
ncbi:MAG: elongation factor 4 [Planctomycetes bacterium]|nr:elongation factor 4 [Planctomycetota bacterium]